jgi:hypothetical protein
MRSSAKRQIWRVGSAGSRYPDRMRAHLEHIYVKLGVGTRTAAAAAGSAYVS